MRVSLRPVLSICATYTLTPHCSVRRQSTATSLLDWSQLVLSRLDYCNAVLATIFQRINTVTVAENLERGAARLVLDLKPRDHVTSAFASCTGYSHGYSGYTDWTTSCVDSFTRH